MLLESDLTHCRLICQSGLASRCCRPQDIGEQQILENYIVDELGSSVDMEDPPSDPRIYMTSDTPSETSSRILQIIHVSDMESDFQDVNTLEDKVNHYSALTAGLYQLADSEGASTVHVTAGDNALPG